MLGNKQCIPVFTGKLIAGVEIHAQSGAVGLYFHCRWRKRFALGGFVVAQALIFVPLLWIAFAYAPGAIQSAAVVTLGGFVGLTFIAFYTRKDFSFMRAGLMWGGIGALILIATSVLFGFHLGTWFSVGMVLFAGAAILYDTSNILHHYPQDKYVAASLALFASIALMFWYVLQLFMSRD